MDKGGRWRQKRLWRQLEGGGGLPACLGCNACAAVTSPARRGRTKVQEKPSTYASQQSCHRFIICPHWTKSGVPPARKQKTNNSQFPTDWVNHSGPPRTAKTNPTSSPEPRRRNTRLISVYIPHIKIQTQQRRVLAYKTLQNIQIDVTATQTIKMIK